MRNWNGSINKRTILYIIFENTSPILSGEELRDLQLLNDTFQHRFYEGFKLWRCEYVCTSKPASTGSALALGYVMKIIYCIRWDGNGNGWWRRQEFGKFRSWSMPRYNASTHRDMKQYDTEPPFAILQSACVRPKTSLRHWAPLPCAT
jgi:hypothetical protein